MRLIGSGGGLESAGPAAGPAAVQRPRPVTVTMADSALVRQLQERSCAAEPEAHPARSTLATSEMSSAAPQMPAPSGPPVGSSGSPTAARASPPATGQPPPTSGAAGLDNPTPTEVLGLGDGPGRGRSGTEGSCDWTRLPDWLQLRQVVGAQGWSLLVVDDRNAIDRAQSLVAPDDGRPTVLRDITADVARHLPPGARRVLIRLPAEANETIRTSPRVLVWHQGRTGQWVLE